jgi:hypothetical protein
VILVNLDSVGGQFLLDVLERAWRMTASSKAIRDFDENS